MDDGLYRAALATAKLLSGANYAGMIMALRPGCTPRDLSAFADDLPQRPQRDAVRSLVQAWASAGGSADSLQLCLEALHRRLGEEPVTELVWSGPSVQGAGYRSTEQVIKEMLARATESVLIVSFATRDVVSLREPLRGALGRGLKVRMVLEHYDVMKKASWEDRIRGLGEDVLSRAQVLVWPLGHRPSIGSEIRGSLHAKCLAVDRKEMLLTSANWTTTAMESNIELGVRTADAQVVERACAQIDGLVGTGELVRWSRGAD